MTGVAPPSFASGAGATLHRSGTLGLDSAAATVAGIEAIERMAQSQRKHEPEMALSTQKHQFELLDKKIKGKKVVRTEEQKKRCATAAKAKPASKKEEERRKHKKKEAAKEYLARKKREEEWKRQLRKEYFVFEERQRSKDRLLNMINAGKT